MLGGCEYYLYPVNTFFPSVHLNTVYLKKHTYISIIHRKQQYFQCLDIFSSSALNGVLAPCTILLLSKPRFQTTWHFSCCASEPRGSLQSAKALQRILPPSHKTLCGCQTLPCTHWWHNRRLQLMTFGTTSIYLWPQKILNHHFCNIDIPTGHHTFFKMCFASRVLSGYIDILNS